MVEKSSAINYAKVYLFFQIVSKIQEYVSNSWILSYCEGAITNDFMPTFQKQQWDCTYKLVPLKWS